MGALSRLVDRAVNRTAIPGPLPASDAARELIAGTPVVDLLVGSALFRKSFVSGGRGHVDLPRLERTGVRFVGLTVATAWPDLRGSLSRWHFRSLGMPASAAGSHLAIAEWLIGRIQRWCAVSAGRLKVIRSPSDTDACLAPGGPVGVVIGVQGGHVLDGRIENVSRLRELGVRMLAPAHLVDNALVGSSTGRSGAGLTDFGREVIAELEARAISVDLAHMSPRGIEQALPLMRRPFVLSHTGLTDLAGTSSRWRRFSAANRNVPASLAAEVGAAGGLVGVAMSTQLLGGDTLADAVATIRLAIDAAGADHVAVGSDMDGALRMLIDVEGYPALVDALLTSGVSPSAVEGFVGANAASLLRAALDVD